MIMTWMANMVQRCRLEPYLLARDSTRRPFLLQVDVALATAKHNLPFGIYDVLSQRTSSPSAQPPTIKHCYYTIL
jgi:hypothetical protein